MRINFTLNHQCYSMDLPPELRLIDLLRETFSLTGTKEGCGEGECGACTVIIDNLAVNSCLVLACQLEHKNILTIEGLAQNGELAELQQAFIEAGAIQCGFCTSGMILSAKALLLANPKPTESEIRTALSGNICRCSGYSQIIAAINKVAEGGK